MGSIYIVISEDGSMPEVAVRLRAAHEATGVKLSGVQ